jgi:hypothetical protein
MTAAVDGSSDKTGAVDGFTGITGVVTHTRGEPASLLAVAAAAASTFEEKGWKALGPAQEKQPSAVEVNVHEPGQDEKAPHEQLSEPSAVATGTAADARLAYDAAHAEIGSVGSKRPLDHADAPLDVTEARLIQTVEPAASPDSVRVCGEAARPTEMTAGGRSNSADTNARRSTAEVSTPVTLDMPVDCMSIRSESAPSPICRAAFAATNVGEPETPEAGTVPIPGMPKAEEAGELTVSLTRVVTTAAPPTSCEGQNESWALEGLEATNAEAPSGLTNKLRSAASTAAAVAHPPPEGATRPLGSHTKLAAEVLPDAAHGTDAV